MVVNNTGTTHAHKLHRPIRILSIHHLALTRAAIARDERRTKQRELNGSLRQQSNYNFEFREN